MRSRSAWRWPFLAAGLAAAVVLAGGLVWWAGRPSRVGPPPPASPPPPRFVGSAACRDCHVRESEAWAGSQHRQAERGLDLERDRAAFDPPRTVKSDGETWQLSVSGGAAQVVARDADGKRKAFRPVRILGVAPLWQMLVPRPGVDDGRLQVAQLAYDPGRGEWFDVFAGEARQPGEWGHWTGRGLTWNAMCAACHNTGLNKGYQAGGDRYATAAAEMGVGCEACHGPRSAHVEERRARPAAAAAPRERLAPLDACGSCHARRSDLTASFTPGERFLDHYLLLGPDATETYYPDGQVKDEDFELGSFLGSRMHAAGVHCLDCHDPHSGRLKQEGDALCQRCHGGGSTLPGKQAPLIDPATHTHHRPHSAGARCVGCHMPETAYMQRDRRRDHGFTSPDPQLTVELGVPNACSRCHADRDATWALARAADWYGAKLERPARARARLVARGRAGRPDARPGLLRMLREEEVALWRAQAAHLLQAYAGDPAAAEVLTRALGDADPLVRAAAARALGPAVRSPPVNAALQPLLGDPLRAVRVEAAWSLRARLDLDSLAGRELLTSLATNADEPPGLFQAGILRLERGEVGPAVELLRRAVAWDPGASPARQALAVALSTQGDRAGAVRELREACRVAPSDAACQRRLALGLRDLGREEEAAAALRAAVRIDPAWADAWYELAALEAERGHKPAALDALDRALALAPAHEPAQALQRSLTAR